MKQRVLYPIIAVTLLVATSFLPSQIRITADTPEGRAGKGRPLPVFACYVVAFFDDMPDLQSKAIKTVMIHLTLVLALSFPIAYWILLRARHRAEPLIQQPGENDLNPYRPPMVTDELPRNDDVKTRAN